MADEKYKNEDPEEEKDDQFDDDEDFGLPDLEYDELDDDDPEIDEEPDFEEPAEEPDTPNVVGEDPDEVLGEDELDEDVEINVEDIDDSETEDWEKELEKELEEELKAEGASGGFYEEESYEDFETAGDEQEIKGSVFSSDESDESFGQDSGVNNGSEYTEKTTSSYEGGTGGSPYAASYSESNASKGKFAKTVVIGTLAFAIIAVVLWLLWDGSESEPEQPVVKKEEPTPLPQQPVKQEPEPVQEEKTPAEPERAQPNTVAPGEITVLNQQTGKSYVVIGSFFDSDMANDYAQELAAEGKSPMVIPPFKDYRFYRVAIAEFNNFKDAQASIEGYKNEYGLEVWPLRY